MSIDIQWDNAEQTTLRLDFSGAWGWDELNAANVQIMGMMAEAGQPVSVIAHLLPGSRPLMPENPLALFKAINGDERSDGLQAGGVIVVGLNPLLRRLYQGAVRAAGQGSVSQNLRFANSLEEARALATQPTPPG